MQNGSARAHGDIAHVNILGVHVSAITPQSAIAVLQTWIRDRTLSYVCVTGVHGVMESSRDLELRRIHNEAGLVTPDGMPLVWMSHRLGFPHVERVYGPDLMRDMTALSAEHGYRNFYYGGTDGTPERLRDVLTRRHPGSVLLLATIPLSVVGELEAIAPDPHTIGDIVPFLAVRGLAEGIAEACVALVLVELCFQLIDSTPRS